MNKQFKQVARTEFSHKGFTLIELLVVVAIIGMLAAVILFAVTSARSKGADGAIKANMHSVQNEADLYYQSHASSYAGLCTGDDTAIEAMLQACSAAGISSCGTAAAFTPATLATAQDATTIACHENGTAYAISIVSNSNQSNSWCIDSVPSAKIETGAANYLAANAVVCP